MAHRSTSELFDLVRLAYAAAGTADGWPAFLERLGVVMGAQCTSFLFWQRRDGTSLASFSAGPVGRETTEGYNAYYGAINPLMRRNPHLMRAGSITLQQMKCPTQEFLRSEYYNDFVRRLDVAAGMGICVAEQRGVCAHLSWLRSLRVGLWDAEDVRFVRPLVPHLQRSLQLHQTLAELSGRFRDDAGALDQLSVGVLVVSAAGDILIANRAAEDLLRAGTMLTADRRRIRVTNRAKDHVLHALIVSCARTTRGDSLASGGVLELPGTDGGPGFEIIVAPAALDVSYPRLGHECVTVVARDLGAASTAHAAMANCFGLTAAEARLLQHLLEGRSLRDAGEVLGIGLETARTHLRHIFDKTGVRRQSRLMRLAINGLARQVHSSTFQQHVAWRGGPGRASLVDDSGATIA